MKNEEAIKQEANEALQQLSTIDQEGIDQVCQALVEEATELFGPGVYIKGVINRDMGGVNFKFKRPSIAQRFSFFVACDISRDAPVSSVNPVDQDNDTNTSKDAEAVNYVER